LSAIAKAVLSQAGKELAATAGKGLKQRVLGDPEQKALQRALARAYASMQALNGTALAKYDVNPSFLQYEGAPELAKVLTPEVISGAVELARSADDWMTRRDAVNILGATEPTPQIRT
jgi:hypothetical protein